MPPRPYASQSAALCIQGGEVYVADTANHCIRAIDLDHRDLEVTSKYNRDIRARAYAHFTPTPTK